MVFVDSTCTPKGRGRKRGSPWMVLRILPNALSSLHIMAQLGSEKVPGITNDT